MEGSMTWKKRQMRESGCLNRVVIRRRQTEREAWALHKTNTFPLNETFVFQLSVLRVNIGFFVRELHSVANNHQLKSNSNKQELITNLTEGIWLF